ncbi:hypothetical protein EJ04DRAFT_517792 [Polyplosphaeria fusca]|uniref:Uncharacterized protein n=1 Tax=Polyplosphaeria fusca TaxID=682080 RepID=A0A9P4QH94_9PLEO|nr:hypothetical protein EJ04DRAFT_517792 [Polyplosphaeria fusca]
MGEAPWETAGTNLPLCCVICAHVRSLPSLVYTINAQFRRARLHPQSECPGCAETGFWAAETNKPHGFAIDKGSQGIQTDR